MRSVTELEAEIARLRIALSNAERPPVHAQPIQCLDHGYVKLIDSWGRGEAGVELDDYECGIIEAARQSTQGSFRGWATDEKLLGFLYNSIPPHATPFEFAGMVAEIKGPILVFREWHRHRIQSVAENELGDAVDDTAFNEMSARYAPLPDINYVPTVERCFLTQAKNKQAQGVAGANDLTEEFAKTWLCHVQEYYRQGEALYQCALSGGIPKEVARVVVTVGRYSQMRVSTSLRNWLAFLTLRMNPNAQWEIRQFANAVGELIAQRFPKTWSLYHRV